MTAISESELVFPALVLLARAGDGGLTTTKLSQQLRDLLQPSGHDLLPLEGRNDDIFSQKVRNLKSHNTLEETGMVTRTALSSNTLWRITPDGRRFVEDHDELLDVMERESFPTVVAREALTSVAPAARGGRRRALVFDEDGTITEGGAAPAMVNRRERSRALRDAAIAHFTKNGTIVCIACGFDYRASYGDHGQGYIEIHHRKPLSMYDDEDLTTTIKLALKNVAPLCSNCHRMVHRMPAQVLTVEDLTDLVGRQRKK